MGQIESWQFYVMFCFYWFLCFTCFCIPRWLLVERRQRWWKWWNWVNWILATLWSNYWVIRVPWLAAALFCFFCLSRSPTLAPEIGAIVIHSTQNWRRFSYFYPLRSKKLIRTLSGKKQSQDLSNSLVPCFKVSITMLLQHYLGMKGFN